MSKQKGIGMLIVGLGVGAFLWTWTRSLDALIRDWVNAYTTWNPDLAIAIGGLVFLVAIAYFFGRDVVAR